MSFCVRSIRIFSKFSGDPYYEPLSWFMIHSYTCCLHILASYSYSYTLCYSWQYIANSENQFLVCIASYELNGSETIKQKALQLACKQARYGWLHKDFSIWFLASYGANYKKYTDKL